MKEAESVQILFVSTCGPIIRQIMRLSNGGLKDMWLWTEGRARLTQVIAKNICYLISLQILTIRFCQGNHQSFFKHTESSVHRLDQFPKRNPILFIGIIGYIQGNPIPSNPHNSPCNLVVHVVFVLWLSPFALFNFLISVGLSVFRNLHCYSLWN